ncbi:zinc metalloprotease HtpX [Natribacillus halophilus]|uniref:zinc metalloprotease HtpX n=1 Tax=Natribacillus halophilus TaxID=549003 RepID=UPI001FDFAD0A|nr:zinc metalloprotease HtpX [Natribacillus halophilus]
MMYKQIERNKRHTVFIVIGFILFVLAVGAAITYLMAGEIFTGMILALVLGGAYTTMMLMSSTNVVMRMNHAKEVKDGSEYRRLWDAVDNMAMVARIPRPRLFIINDASPNAFATGTSPEKGAVAVTSGLLERLNHEEVEGVIAHEVAHIRNYDIRLATIAVALVSVIAIISDLGIRMMFFSRGGGNNNKHPILLILALVLIIIAPIVAMMIRMAISRKREYLADASAVELTRNPGALAKALEKISGVSQPVSEASGASASIYFSDPLKRKTAQLFSSHPPPQERIKRLYNM